MESRWVTERAGRLETQCALERPPLQRAALAAEAAERQMWTYLPCCEDTPSPDQRGRPHRKDLQLEQQQGVLSVPEAQAAAAAVIGAPGLTVAGSGTVT